MAGAINQLIEFVTWLFFTSVKATVVIALIFIVQIGFRRRLSAKWQHVLWLLLIARLVIPFDIPSPLSIFNLTHDVQVNNLPLLLDEGQPYFPPADIITSQAVAPSTVPQSTIRVVANESQNRLSPLDLLGFGWFLLAISLLFYMLAMNVRLQRQISRGLVVSNAEILTILACCQKHLNQRGRVEIVAMNTRTPFGFGIVKRRIIIPSAVLKENNFEKLEHIFLHELAHFKQQDIPLALLAAALQILHWFNPFIWIAFFKMRADRELACDELVLTTIGQDKNKAYGRTLISLIESASQRGLLPVAVGLADTTFNLKRRVTMISNFAPKSIWWTAVALFILSTSAMVVLTGAVEQGNVRGTVTFSGATSADSIYVGIYPFSRWGISTFPAGEELIALSRATATDFSFHLERGAYCIAAWAFGHDPAFTNFVVPDDKTTLHFDFELQPLSLPEKYDKVTVVGDFCDWSPAVGLPLTFDGHVWRLESPNIPKRSAYYFSLSLPKEEPRSPTSCSQYSPDNKNNIFVPEWATFHNIYEGGDIVLDPTHFQHPAQRAHIEIEGLGYEEQLNTVFRDYDNFLSHHYSRFGDSTPEKFAKMLVAFDSLKAQYDPNVRTILAQRWLGAFAFQHPYSRLLGTAYSRNGDLDTLAYLVTLKSDVFIDYVDVCMRQIEDVDFNSPLFGGRICLDLLQLQRMLDDAPASIRERYGIAKNHFEDILVNVVKNGTRHTASQILADFITAYTFAKKYQKAEFYFEWMKRDFADTPAFLYEVQDFVDQYLLLRHGAQAPQFTAQTLAGDLVNVADYKGKFLLLDFWAPWSGQSVLDVPHKIKLAQSIPGDSLAFLGLVTKNDDLAVFITEHHIPYTNAVLTEEIEKQYAINFLPTTYLIDPDGRIVTRKLGGEELTAQVREQMRLYAAER